jgi:hypothetical protein
VPIASDGLSLNRHQHQIISDNLKTAGWSWGWVSALDSQGRTIWIADAHRGDGKRFVVRSDEKLTAFGDSERRPRPYGCGREVSTQARG